MASMSTTNIWFLITALILSLFSLSASAKKTYIIYMNHNSKPSSYRTHHDWYRSLTSNSSESFLYTYTTAFYGFAAHLDPREAKSLGKMESVLHVFEERIYSLHTTHSPQFLGLDANLGFSHHGSKFQPIEQASEDVIVGVLDSGVWPESKSFDDTGMPPIPKRWKGRCKSTKDFDHKLCNRKLIGSRYFIKGRKKATGSKDIVSARDYNGHGTHTASTIAGSPVADASMFGYAQGTARGMAVRARVASYKVCWSDGCSESDILAGMEKALSDGVDVLSISIGPEK